jgi:hypothetical protein
MAGQLAGSGLALWRVMVAVWPIPSPGQYALVGFRSIGAASVCQRCGDRWRVFLAVRYDHTPRTVLANGRPSYWVACGYRLAVLPVWSRPSGLYAVAYSIRFMRGRVWGAAAGRGFYPSPFPDGRHSIRPFQRPYWRPQPKPPADFRQNTLCRQWPERAPRLPPQSGRGASRSDWPSRAATDSSGY